MLRDGLSLLEQPIALKFSQIAFANTLGFLSFLLTGLWRKQGKLSLRSITLLSTCRAQIPADCSHAYTFMLYGHRVSCHDEIIYP